MLLPRPAPAKPASQSEHTISNAMERVRILERLRAAKEARDNLDTLIDRLGDTYSDLCRRA